MAFQEKIIEVQGLLDRVNATLKEQLDMVNQVGVAIGKYSGKLPSDFINAQKEAIALSKAQQEEIKKLSLIEKEAEAVKQKQIATQIKVNQEKKSAIALTNAEAQSQAKAATEANRTALANEKLNRAYVQLNMQRTVAKNKLQDLIASEQASNKEIRIAQKEFDTLDKRVQKANHAVGNFSSSVGNYKNALSGVGNLMSAFGISTGLYLGASIIKDIYETTKQLQSLDLALKMVSDTQENYASNTSFIRDISEKWGIEIKGLTEQFTQFYVNAKGKISDTDIKTTFEGIAKAGSLMGISIDKQNDAFYAFNQMLSKGTVQAEELKKQLGNALPGAIKAATMAYQELNPHLKVTEQMMLDEMKAGNLISNEMVPAIIRAYQKLYGIEMVKSVDTLAAAQNRLSNSWTDMIRSMNDSETGGIQSFFKVMLGGFDAILQKMIQANDSWGEIFNKAEKRGRSFAKGFFNDDMVKYQGKKPLSSDEKQAIQDRVAEINEEIIKAQKEGLGLKAGALQAEKNDLVEQLFYSDPANKSNKLKSIRDRAQSDYTDYAREYNAILAEAGKKAGGMNFTGIGDDNRNDFIARYKNKRKQDLKQFMGTQMELIKIADTELNAALKTSAVNTGGKAESEKDKKARLAKEKAYQEYLEALRRNAFARELSDLERELEVIEDNYARKKNLGNEYIKYAFQMADKENDIIDLKYAEEMRLAKKNGKSKEDILNLEKIATNKYHTDLENAYKKHLETLDKIKYDNKNGVTDTGPIADQETYGSGVFVLDPKRMEEAVDAWKKYKDGVDKSGEALKKLKDMLREFYQQTEGEFFSEAGFAKTFDMFLKLDETGKSTFDKLMEAAKGTKEEFAVAFIAIAESAKEAFNFISNLSQENFDAEYDRLERQKEDALRFAGDSAAGRAEIERQYERKRQQIQRREAKAKKDQAMFTIAIDTARAVMAFLAQGNFGMAIAAGIIGGIQLAAVSSKEIPNYFIGTDNAPEGVAWTQEKGQEIITDKSGKIKDMGDNKGPRLTYLKQGDKVIKNRETLDLLSFNRSYANLMDSTGPVINVEGGGINSERFDEGISRLEKVIKDKPSFQLIDDERGRRLYREYRGERTQLMNDRQNIISRDV